MTSLIVRLARAKAKSVVGYMFDMLAFALIVIVMTIPLSFLILYYLLKRETYERKRKNKQG